MGSKIEHSSCLAAKGCDPLGGVSFGESVSSSFEGVESVGTAGFLKSSLEA